MKNIDREALRVKVYEEVKQALAGNFDLENVLEEEKCSGCEGKG